jgi:signal transduction histidine kinase
MMAGHSTASAYVGGDRPAVRGDAEEDLSRSIERVIKISAAVIVLSALALPFSMTRLGPSLVLHALFALVLAGAHYYRRTHRWRAAGALLSGGFWTVATASVFAFGGVHSPGVFVYLPVVACAGLYWSRRAATALAIASAVSVLFAAQLEALGLLPPPLAPTPPARLWTVFSGSLLITAVLFLTAVRRLTILRRDLAQSKTLLEDLSSAQARAEQERSELEERLRSVERLEAVGRLAGGVAHDFNNLLSIISNSASALRREIPRGSAGAELLGEIDEATRRAIGLAKKLLVNPRRTQNKPVPVDLNEVVAGLSSMLARLAGSDTELVVETRAQQATVLADAGELEQVVLNLALNARDAMPRGGRLAIETERASDAETPVAANGSATYVALIVTDQGIGMDSTTASRIFEPFFTTKGSAGGTGLGLASVKRIVDQAGGRIRVETSPGNGARFEVILPCLPAREYVTRAGETRPA